MRGVMQLIVLFVSLNERCDAVDCSFCEPQ